MRLFYLWRRSHILPHKHVLPVRNIPFRMLLIVTPRHAPLAFEIHFMQGLGLPHQFALFASIAGSCRGFGLNACPAGKACPACNPNQIPYRRFHLVDYVTAAE